MVRFMLRFSKVKKFISPAVTIPMRCVRNIRYIKFILPVLLMIGILGCHADRGSITPTVTFNSRRLTALSEENIRYFSVRDRLYGWNPQNTSVILYDNDFFYKNEARCMTSLNGKIYSINWYTKELLALDPDTGSVESLVNIPAETTIWNWDGKLCCLAIDESQLMQVQIYAEDGTLLRILPLDARLVFPDCATGDWLFYQSGFAASSYALNLETGERQQLLDGEPCAVLTVLDEKLVIQTEDGCIYLDKKGNQSAVCGEEYTWYAGDETAQYFSYLMQPQAGFARAYGRLEDGKIEAVFSLKDPVLDRQIADGVLYMQGDSSVYLLSDSCRLLDATGENAEAVEKANKTRIFENDGDSLTLALTQDDTLYLLNRS